MKHQNRLGYGAFFQVMMQLHKQIPPCNLFKQKKNISQNLEGRKTWILWFAKIYEMVILIAFCTNQRRISYYLATGFIK